MAKCANCEQDAFYTYVVTESFGIDYCSRHLPAFAAKTQSFVLTADSEAAQAAAVAEATAAATKNSKKKAVEPVVEEPVVEEPVAEEPVVEEPVVDDATN